MADIEAVKREHGIPAGAVACHTALVDGYLVEGHVPPASIDRLLAERPAVAGIAVPGMPPGSPGMEPPGQSPVPVDVLEFTKDGDLTFYERR